MRQDREIPRGADDRHAARPGEPARAPRAPAAALLVPLQQGAGNAAVARLLSREPAAAPSAPVPAYPQPTFPREGEPPAGPPPKAYEIAIVLSGRAYTLPPLPAAEAVRRLENFWRGLHESLDHGRGHHLDLLEHRREHWIAGFWSDTLGGVELPDLEMWNEVGRGPLQAAKAALEASDQVMRARWERNEAAIDRGLPDALRTSPLMAEALAFDATEERIAAAVRHLEEGSRQLDRCWERIAEYSEGTIRGGGRAITGIKVSIVVMSAAATGGAGGTLGQGAGLAARSGLTAATGAGLGMAEEAFTQVGEMRIGARDEFDFGRIAKRGAKDVVAGFVGGVVAGRFSDAVRGRLAQWVTGLSDEALATYGVAREELLTGAERFFAEWVGGIGASPFSTTAQVLMDRALEGRWQVRSFGDFAGLVVDDMAQGAALDGFLAFAGRAARGRGGAAHDAPAGPPPPLPPAAGDAPAPARPAAAGPAAAPAPVPAPTGGSPAAPAGPAPARAPGQARAPEPAGAASRVREGGTDLSWSVLGHPGTGLRSAEALLNVTDAAGRVPAPAAGTPMQHYVAQLAAPIQAELARAGTPAPAVEARDLGDPEMLGLYDPARNVIVLNEGAVWQGQRVYDVTSEASRRQMLSTLFHEARHAEQAFLALRYMATHDPAGLSAQALGVHGALVRAARANPMPRGRSAEAELGRRAYEEMFGAGEANARYRHGEDHAGRARIRGEIAQLESDRLIVEGEIAAIRVARYSRSGPQRTRIAELDRRINALQGQLASMEHTYWRLYVEVDARAAEADLAREMADLPRRRQEAAAELDRVIEGLEAEAAADPALADAAAAVRGYRQGLRRLDEAVAAGQGADSGGTGGTGGTGGAGGAGGGGR
ncbi:hypothetical protein [Miltoncostaea marina]|uniref:hypothetical protein n=1 Tax=Miltoncostaea marina TaxID=2843215 RepID=UPI001C3C9CF4|nr:hypothetical protein [Miltoncostaea marina]